MLAGLAVFCISFAVLAYEVLLMRLLTIIQWHHFAYMIISVALLGLGAAGAVVTVWRRALVVRYHLVFQFSAALFAVSMTAAFLLTQLVPLNPLEILWDRRQWGYLGITYLLLFLPFFWSASCIVLTFTHFRERIPSLYRFDLLGAAAGSLGIIGLLSVFHPLTCLRILAAPAMLAAALVSLDAPSRGRWVRSAGWVTAALILPLSWPVDAMTMRLSEYKGLSAALRVPGAQVVAERSSPLGLLTVVASPQIPFRHVPGLSLTCGSFEPPPQLAVFTDGDALSPITQYQEGNLEGLSHLDCTTSALPYHMLKHPRVLVIGAGGGADVLLGRYHRAATIDAVELDPNMIELVQKDFADFSGHLFAGDTVRIHAAEGRAFVTETAERYDLIQVSLLDSFATAASGSLGLSENYLYTVEAFQQYLGHLEEGGYLAVTRWVKVPPRDSLKLFTTALMALERSGVDHPENRVALIRSWQTSTLLVRRGAIPPEDVAAISGFCEARAFDTDYFPGIRPEQTNRFNLLERSYFHDGTLALAGSGRQDFLRRYKFAIEPATDDQPFFFQFFKWQSLAELLSLEGRGGIPLLEWSYPVLILTLVQALAASLVLILVPLALRVRLLRSGQHHCGLIAYFGALGLAFLFVEMAFIQRFVLFLGHPLYAVTVVLTAFLLFAGLGSRFSATLVNRLHTLDTHYGGKQGVLLACGAIVLLGVSYVTILPPVLQACLGLPALVKMATTVFLIAPLAFCMGMPFPLGLAQVGEALPDLLPWAWGINGCASVLSSVLATFLAMHSGFRIVVVAAVLLYSVAAGVAWKCWPQTTPLEEA